MTSFQAEKCCHLMSAHAASARRICSSVRQFLIRTISLSLVYTYLLCDQMILSKVMIMLTAHDLLNEGAW